MPDSHFVKTLIFFTAMCYAFSLKDRHCNPTAYKMFVVAGVRQRGL